MSGTTLTSFTPGDIVISVYGAANGSGTYTLDQASSITLEELTPAGALVGTLVLPETTTVVNGTTEYAISGEYGSASEGTLQLSVDGQSITILGYGVNATAFNTAGATGNSAYGNAALGQSSSTTGGAYTPVARVVADIGYNGAIDTSTSLYNIYNTNNPRSVATVNGTSFYLSGQSVKGTTTQGVFETTDGSSAATAIDTSTDTRNVEIYNGQLYVSRDSTQSTTSGTNIASYGTTLPTAATTPTALPGISQSITLTAAQENSVNASAVGTSVNLSPYGFYFANATTLYVADGGFPKEGGIGDGGLQKWTYNGTSWVLDYTLSAGLNLVPDTATSGTTGLYGITGTVVNGVVQLYVTTSTAGELDQSYLYGISDNLAATTLPTTESFTQLMAAASDSIIRGVSFAPSAAVITPANPVIGNGMSSGGLVVSSGNTLTAQTGGIVTSTTILSGGVATISGTDTAAIVGHGGSETVIGTANGDQIDGTQIVSGAGALISGSIIDNGGLVTLTLGSATNVSVTTGGTLTVSGGSASGTVISGGTVVLATSSATLNGGLTFTGPGTLQAAAVAGAGFGDQAAISGFGVGDVVDVTAITSSGSTFGTVVAGGNLVATITSGGVSESFTFAGLASSSVTLSADANGGAEIVFVPPPTMNVTVGSGSSVPNLTVTSGSTLTVNAGGTVTNTTVLSGGVETNAGTDSGTTLSLGGKETILGSANADQIYGSQLVSAGTAVVTNEVIHSGGIVNDYLKGAILTGTTVQNGGTLNISGNTTASNTTVLSGGLIDLMSPKANVTGTLTFSGGGTLEETAVISAGFGDLAVIAGFTSGASVDVATIAPITSGVSATLTGSTSGGNTIETVSGGGVTQAFTFAGTSYASGYFMLGADAGTGVQITTNTPCYCRGTLIQAEHGEVAVENLQIGDRLVTASGAIRPVKWIGRRSYGKRFTAGNREVLPVVIQAGALGGGMPRRELWISPLHAMYLDGVLIPAKFLVNGHSIVQVAQADLVEYFHVELETHDVILAEGAPSETFVDDSGRGMFHNAQEYRALYPDRSDAPAEYCAPRVEAGALLEAVWQRLAGLCQVTEAA